MILHIYVNINKNASHFPKFRSTKFFHSNTDFEKKLKNNFPRFELLCNSTRYISVCVFFGNLIPFPRVYDQWDHLFEINNRESRNPTSEFIPYEKLQNFLYWTENLQKNG